MDQLVAGYNFELNSHSAFSAAPGHTGAEFQWKSSGALVTVQSKFARLHVPDTLADCETVRASKILPQSRARAYSSTRYPRVVVLFLFAFISRVFFAAPCPDPIGETQKQKHRPSLGDQDQYAHEAQKTLFQASFQTLAKPSRHWPKRARILALCVLQGRQTCKSTVFGTLADCHLPPTHGLTSQLGTRAP